MELYLLSWDYLLLMRYQMSRSSHWILQLPLNLKNVISCYKPATAFLSKFTMDKGSYIIYSTYLISCICLHGTVQNWCYFKQFLDSIPISTIKLLSVQLDMCFGCLHWARNSLNTSTTTDCWGNSFVHSYNTLDWNPPTMSVVCDTLIKGSWY